MASERQIIANGRVCQGGLSHEAAYYNNKSAVAYCMKYHARRLICIANIQTDAAKKLKQLSLFWMPFSLSLSLWLPKCSGNFKVYNHILSDVFRLVFHGHDVLI